MIKRHCRELRKRADDAADGVPCDQILYNHHIPQRNLGHITPVEALKNWQKTHPHLFKKTFGVKKQIDVENLLYHSWTKRRW